MLLEVQCEVSTVSDDLGCHVICWCWSTVFSKSTVNAAIYQEILEHFMLPSADKLYGDDDFIFQQDFQPTLSKVPKAGSMTMVLLCLIGHSGPTQQMTWQPKSSLTVETSHWTSINILCLYSLPPDSGTLISKLNATFTFI